MGILNEICIHMTKFETHRWNNSEILKAALQCETLKEFRTMFPREYNAAYRRRILKTCCEHMKPLIIQPSKWTDEALIEEAKKYQTQKDFRIGSHVAYYTAKKEIF